jgi:hypothetical protein
MSLRNVVVSTHLTVALAGKPPPPHKVPPPPAATLGQRRPLPGAAPVPPAANAKAGPAPAPPAQRRQSVASTPPPPPPPGKFRAPNATSPRAVAQPATQSVQPPAAVRMRPAPGAAAAVSSRLSINVAAGAGGAQLGQVAASPVK